MPLRPHTVLLIFWAAKGSDYTVVTVQCSAIQYIAVQKFLAFLFCVADEYPPVCSGIRSMCYVFRRRVAFTGTYLRSSMRDVFFFFFAVPALPCGTLCRMEHSTIWNTLPYGTFYRVDPLGRPAVNCAPCHITTRAGGANLR